MPRQIYFLLLVFFHQSAFAICEDAEREAKEWHNRCSQLSGASQVAGNSALGVATLGISLGVSAGFSAAAANACRIRDEKRNNLNHCFEENKRRGDMSISKARSEAARELEFTDHLNLLKKEVAAQVKEEEAICQKKIQEFLENYAQEGWDMDSMESLQVITAQIQEFEAQRNHRIHFLYAAMVRDMNVAHSYFRSLR